MRRFGPTAMPVVLVVGVCLLVAALALPPSNATPPAVAELSPNAVVEQDEIEETPDLAGGDTGAGATPSGPGDEAPATTEAQAPTATTPASTTSTVPENAVRRRCVPNGDGTARQTEDPQSPPCVPFSAFDATNNGGATARGVTADEIRVAVPQREGQQPQVAAMFQHVNERFEMHGRRLVPVLVGVSPSYSDPAAYTQLAVEVAEEEQVFASTFMDGRGQLEDLYYRELAARQVIGVHDGQVLSWTAAELAGLEPYAWSIPPPYDVAATINAEWLCSALAGEPTAFSGSVLDGQPRNFALVLDERADGSRRPIDPMLATLAACGIEPDPIISFPADAHVATTDVYTPSQETRQAILQMRSANTTTVILEMASYAAGALMVAAEQQGWSPEWTFPATNPNPYSLREFPAPTQMSSTFGPYFTNPPVPFAVSAAGQAVLEQDPTLDGADAYNLVRNTYRSLLVIASGVQAAGPELTPESFAAALESTRWANVSAGVAPRFPPSVDFVPGEPWWNRDVAIAWFDPTEGDAESATLCYVDGGSRFRSSWPDATSLFQPRRNCAP